MKDQFRKLATVSAEIVGAPWSFVISATLIAVWALSGPHYHYSDTWELVVNTGTSVITFLMVFLIQNTQNRDAKAMHLKLDELLRGVAGARTGLVNLETLSDEDLAQLKGEFERLQKSAGNAPSASSPALPTAGAR